MKSLALMIALFGLLYMILSPQETMDKTSLVYNITGCAENGEEIITKGPSRQDFNATINTANNTITYYRALNHQCCKKVTIEKTINESIITLNEQWTGEACKCMCYSEINATITGLKTGNYTINVNALNETITSQNITIQ